MVTSISIFSLTAPPQQQQLVLTSLLEVYLTSNSAAEVRFLWSCLRTLFVAAEEDAEWHHRLLTIGRSRPFGRFGTSNVSLVRWHRLLRSVSKKAGEHPNVLTEWAREASLHKTDALLVPLLTLLDAEEPSVLMCQQQPHLLDEIDALLQSIAQSQPTIIDAPRRNALLTLCTLKLFASRWLFCATDTSQTSKPVFVQTVAELQSRLQRVNASALPSAPALFSWLSYEAGQTLLCLARTLRNFGLSSETDNPFLVPAFLPWQRSLSSTLQY